MQLTTRLLTVIAVLFSIPSYGESINIAVAANFTLAMKELAAEYEQQSGHEVTLSFGSSGKFYAQIKNGAPYQAFFSADQAKPAALAKDGLTSGEPSTYAIGTLALWSTDENKVDDQADVLNTGDFNKLAIANPKLAPYGLAAEQTLQSLGLLELVQGKLVRGENISQTYQFAFSGNAELGFVALSQIMTDGEISKGSAWLVPTDLHDPIRQDAVILKSAEGHQAVRDFVTFVQSEQAKKTIHRYGYKTP